MLELRPNCELCDADLPPESETARICSYECTFCATCVDEVLRDVCPNCGGGFQPRPVRPEVARRPGVSLADQPPATERVLTRYSREEIDAFTIEVQDVPPAFR